MREEMYGRPKDTSTQGYFDHVKTHLLTQARRCQVVTGGGVTCRLRAPDGTACAIGCCLSDAEARANDEDWQVAPMHELRTQLQGLLNVDAEADMLLYLMKVHDMLRPSLWWMGLNAVARAWGVECSLEGTLDEKGVLSAMHRGWVLTWDLPDGSVFTVRKPHAWEKRWVITSDDGKESTIDNIGMLLHDLFEDDSGQWRLTYPTMDARARLWNGQR